MLVNLTLVSLECLEEFESNIYPLDISQKIIQKAKTNINKYPSQMDTQCQNYKTLKF